MELTHIQTLRNGFPCTALRIHTDTMERVASAFLSGVRIQLSYANLKGVLECRECYVEAVYPHLFYIVIKHRDFGYRTVFLERINEVK